MTFFRLFQIFSSVADFTKRSKTGIYQLIELMRFLRESVCFSGNQSVYSYFKESTKYIKSKKYNEKSVEV